MIINFIAHDYSVTYTESTLEEFEENQDRQKVLEQQVDSLAIKTATVLEIQFNEQLSELALVCSVDEDNNLLVLEANPNGPRSIRKMDHYAQTILAYALSLHD